MKQLVNRMVVVQVPHPKTGALETHNGLVVGFTLKRDDPGGATDELIVKTWRGTAQEDVVVRVPFDSYPDKNARRA